MKTLWLPVLVSLLLSIVLILSNLTESSLLVWIVALVVLFLLVWIIGRNYDVTWVRGFFIAILAGFFMSVFYSLIVLLLWVYVSNALINSL